MSIVRLARVVREVGDFTILDHVDASIAAGDRIGLVGPNGAGKTTLLRLVVGLDEPEEGEVHRKRGLTIGMLRQETHVDSSWATAASLRLAVRAGAQRLEVLERTLRQFEHEGRVTDPEYEEAQHEFAVKDGYALDQRVEAALSGLGFERDQWDRPPTSMSGGEQTRAALARLLLGDPELLLLDEPTNHLDLGALEWLEEFLARRHGTLLVASHDRAFLDATVTRVWELRDRKLTPFRGSYSAYNRQREERDIRAVEEAEARAGQIVREQELIQQYRHQRKHGKMHEHEARLEALEPVEKRRADARLRLPTEALAGGSPARSYESVVRADGLVVGYGAGRARSGAARRDDATARGENGTARGNSAGTRAEKRVAIATVPWLELRRGDRVGIVGPNGAGKTTLLRTIAGELPPLDGALDLGKNVQLSYLAQLRDAPIPGATVLDAILDEMPLTAGAARSHLARFLFRGDDALKEVAALSGGERSRLELALLFLLPSNLLLLDEPTNHLDIPAREALESFMGTTDATLVIVSHDRRLLETVCESLWVVDDGLAVPFEGGYRAWRAAVADGWTVKSAAEREANRLHGGRSQATNGRKPAGAIGAAARKGVAKPPDPAVASAPLTPAQKRAATKLSKDTYRRRKAAVDEELTHLVERRRSLESAMQDPSVHGNFVELRRVSGELATVNDALAAAEEAWLELEETAP
jgi:ATP-binding cassette subfamily F protein 3